MNFKLFWENENEEIKEITLTETKGRMGEDIFCNGDESLNWYLLEKGNGEYFLRIENKTEKDITGRGIVKFKWQNPEKGYTLVPGVFYNGNYHEMLNATTCLHMPEKPRFRVSLAAAASPHVIWWDGDKSGYSVYFSPKSCAGFNGLTLDGEKEEFSFRIPAGDDDIYTDDIIKRYPFTWHSGDIVCVEFQVKDFKCENIPDLFEFYWDKASNTKFLKKENKFRFGEEETAEYVREWILSHHYMETKDGKPIFKNALLDFDREPVPEEFKEWNIMIGWCSGTMTALPLLACEGAARERALKYIDFLTSEGFSPSGIKMPVFDGYEWIDPREGYCPDKNNQYQHVRFYGDYLYYLGRCIRYEKSRGESHPLWEADFKRETELFLNVWEKNGDFGMYWDIMGDEIKIIRSGTGAGAFALLALTEAYTLEIQKERVKKCLYEADKVYFERCVASGHCNAGPNDIKEADDSESIAALTDAFTRQYELFGDEQILDMAVAAGHIFSSWVVAYSPEFPEGSPLCGINVCGGVIANARNRHIGPGICTNSGMFLKKLGRFTGDNRWTEMYSRIRNTAYNCVCLNDGEFFSEDFRDSFRKGMVTEQINIYDIYRKPGFAWCVSACWPATDILLSEFDEKNEE